MSGYNNNWSDDEGFENEAQSQGGGSFRKLLEESLAENKKLRAAIEGNARGQSTAALLKDKGLDPAIAELIPEGQDAGEWVTKYAHLLGVPANTETNEPVVEPDVQVSDDADPAIVARREELAAERAALESMSDAAASGSPAVQSALLEQMDKITSEDELIKFFNANGLVGG